MKREDYKSFDDLPLMISVKELSALLGVSVTTAYELTKEKGFPCIKLRGRLVIPKDKLIEWLDRKTKEGGRR